MMLGIVRCLKVAIRVSKLDNNGAIVATYRSITEASKSVDSKGRGIKACCEGRQATYRGYCWTFAKE